MNKKLNKMNYQTYKPKMALSFAFILALGLCQLMYAQTPTVTVRFANPEYACATGQYCLDVEFQADMDSVELFGMNVRFFYDDELMELDSFADFQGGYDAVAPDPPTVLMSAPGVGYSFFGFGDPGTGVADFVNGAMQLVDDTQPPIYIDTAGWTYIFQVCFTLDSVPDSTSFCPPVVWDLEQDPANGGFLAGDDGVVMTVVDPTGMMMSIPADENVVQFNWQYVGTGTPPFGEPVEEICISLECIPEIVCPADITMDCGDSTDPENTGFATATEVCLSPVTITFSDSTTAIPGECVSEVVITRTWIATNECNISDTCVQLITVIDTTGPVLLCPPDITIECDESTDPSNTGQAVATDACDPSPVVVYIDVTVAGTCPQEYTIDRIWIATDTCGNNNDILCRQTITLIDDTPPVITCPVDLTLECSDPIPTDSATATDNCSSIIEYGFTDILCDNPVMGFTGLYDFSNWVILTPNGGSVTLMGDTEVMLEGPDGAVPCSTGASVLFQIVIPSTGQLVFDWNYTSFDVDGPFFDPFGYNLNGTFFQLTDDDGPLSQSGTATLAVTAGDVFAFEQNSIDCIFGQGATTVVEFFACIDDTSEACTQLVIRNHTATDECGNQSSCIQTIYIQDTTPPVITCPADTIIDCDASTSPDSTGTGFPIAIDNCDTTLLVEFTDSITPGECVLEYTITRVWTATDACGLSSSCQQIITVQDTTPPLITCPTDLTIECTDSTLPDSTGFASATDNCDTLPGITFSETIVPGTCPQEMTILRVWIATDTCGNASTCLQTIQVIDTLPPVITCPVDVTIECTESTSPDNTGLASATDNCDTLPVITFIDSIAPGICPQEMTITRTWTATDACGNSSSCDQIISVIDTIPPAITCPADITIECDQTTSPELTGIASAIDNCDTAPLITSSDVTLAGSCPQEYTIQRTWTATDACGNSSSCLQIIGVEDNTPPVITCPEDVTLACTDTIPTDTATAVDNCSNLITYSFTDIMCDNPVQGFTGIYDFTNWTIILPPEGGSVTPMGDSEVMLVSPDDVTFCDDASVLFQIVIPSTGQLVFDWNYLTNDSDGPAFDPFGYNLNGTFFQLTDNGGPDAQSGTTTIVVTAGDVFAFEQQSTDCIFGAGATTVIEFFACIDDTADVCTQLIIRTHTAADECGNESSCVQTLFVVDTIAPTITCPLNVTLECVDSTLPDSTGFATATDNCDTLVDIVFVDDITISSECPENYTITRTWTATDNCGNSSSCVQVITVQDTTAPVITCPVDVTVECDDFVDIMVNGDFETMDFTGWTQINVGSGGITINDGTFIPPSGDGPYAPCEGGAGAVTFQGGPGVHTLYQDITIPATSVSATLSWIDRLRNHWTAYVDPSQEFRVEVWNPADNSVLEQLFSTDPGDPLLSDCLQRSADLSSYIGQTIRIAFTQEDNFSFFEAHLDAVQVLVSDSAASTGIATAIDICDTNVWITYVDVVTSGACPQAMTIDRTWTASDNCGNSSTCVQTITVEDVTPPEITCPVDVTIECDADTSPDSNGSASATDNCDTIPLIASTDVTIAGSCAQEYTIERTWTATDACGNSTTCLQTITVQDNTPPVITCPEDVTLACTDTIPTDTATAVDNCSNLITYSFTDIMCDNPVQGFTGIYDFANWAIILPPEGGSVTPMGDSEVMLVSPDDTTACDDASVLFQITITTTSQLVFDWNYLTNDIDGPSFDPFGYNLNGTFFQLTDDGGPDAQSGTTTVAVTAGDVFAFEQQSDDCIFGAGATTVVEFFACIDDTAEVCTQLIIRTHTAADECGNESSCVQTLFVVDSIAPIITCPVNLTIDCDASTLPDSTGFATATDDCDLDITIDFVDVTDITIGQECPESYTITRTWIATDNCGNSSSCIQVIAVQDTAAPVITCPADVTVECDAFVDIMVNGDFETMDFTGWTQINSGFGGITINDGTFDPEGPDGPLPPCEGGSGSVTFQGGPGVHTLYQDVTIPAGSVSAMLSWVDRIRNHAGLYDEHRQEFRVEIWDPSDNSVLEELFSTNPGDPQLNDCLQRAADLSAYIGQTIRIAFTEEDTFFYFNAHLDAVELLVSPTAASTGVATATDNCDTSVWVTFADVEVPGSCPQESTITRTWTASDNCGNSSTCVQTITVDDSTPPEITCPVDVTIECDADTSPDSNGSASATDNCDTAPLVSSSDVTIAGSCAQEYTIERTWTATDACGNSSTCLQTISVQDNTPPVITCPEDVTLACTDTIPTDTATAVDNCSNLITYSFTDIMCDNPVQGFTGIYDFTNWTIILPPEGGSVTPMGDSEVMLVSPDDVTVCDDASVLFQIVIPSTGQLVFDWNYLTNDSDGPAFDPFGYNLNGTFFQLTDNGGTDAQSGTTTVAVTAGDVFAFEQQSTDCIFGAGATTVIEFFACVDDTADVCTQLIIRTHTAADECGNESSCVQTLFVIDSIAPTITCPVDLTINCDASTLPDSTGFATATDDCDTDITIDFVDVTLPGSCAESNTITRTWTATDNCGNSTSCIQLITVQDTTPPVITCPVDVTIDCDAFEDIMVNGGFETMDFTGWTQINSGAGGIGINDGTLDPAGPDGPLPPCDGSSGMVTFQPGPGVHTLYQDVTIPVGSVSAMLSWIDMIRNHAALYDEHRQEFRVEIWDPSDNSVLEELFSTDPGDPLLNGCLQRAADLSAYIGQTIRIAFTEEDTFNFFNAHLDAVKLLVSPAVASTGVATATDNCDTNVWVTFIDVATPGSCPQESTIDRTWTASDNCGNSSTCVQVITVQDTTPPLLTCPADITLDCENANTSPDVTGIASATDNCDDQPIVDFADVTIDDTCPEIIQRTWTATDACGNIDSCIQLITISDTTAPVIICPTDVTVTCASEVPPVLTGGVTVSDNCGFITVTHGGDIVTDSVCLNRFTIGRVYVATDECGNTATCVQAIVVFDDVPPMITCPPGVTVSCASQVPPVNTGSATATDNCAGPVTITHAGDVTTNMTCANRFTLIRTYRATDACGNSSTCTQVITVFDNTPPMITCPANVTVSCASQVPPVNTALVITSDNCGGVVTVTHVGDVTTNMTCANRFTLTRTYRATDVCGNSATCTQVITVFDNTPPVITCPPNITVAFGSDTSPTGTGFPTGSDNCGGTPTFTFTNMIIPGLCPEEFTINRTWTATDACGLTATCVQVIFVDGDCIVDLTLTKTYIDAGPIEGGDDLLFIIEIENEGEVSIGSITITDYIPLGFSLNDPDWTPGTAGSTGQSASIILSIANGGLDANGLNPGEIVTVNILLIANEDVEPGCYENTAEITQVFDVNGVDVTDDDIDSQPDDIDTNDPPAEDDHDIAPLCVLPDVVIVGDGFVCPDELSTYSVLDFNPDWTYEWSLNGGGVIVADNGSDIQIQWQDEPGGPFTITLVVTLCDGCVASTTFIVFIQGIEEIACNDLVQISLGPDCQAVVQSGMILEGENEGNNNYFVIITDEFGNVIPDATLTGEHVGQCFTVTVVNECNDQSCWGTICVEDKIPPAIECTDVTVSCGTSLEPVFEPPVTGSASELVISGLPIGPNAGTVTTQDIILDVPANAVVTDVNVTIDLDHTWSADLEVVLISPSGTVITLASAVCGSADNWENVTFDDQAGILVTNACNGTPPPALLAGSVIPQELLAPINGQTAVGTWVLQITDLVNADGGTLNEVTLDVEYFLAVPSAPTASDACGEVTLTYTETQSGEDCEDLTITRIWTATDESGNTATCVQVITVTPLTLDNVDFPPAFVGECGESILPDHTGWPTVNGTPITDENELCNIFVGYWDKELNECGGGRKIVRTWTILDWCTVEIVEAVQVIKLSDTEGPELTCPEDFEVGTDFWYCYANVSVPKPVAVDECSEIAVYQLISSSGIVVSFGNNFVINELGLGTHTVTWIVSDECGNSSSCSFEITVVDDVVPVANCDEHTIVSLTNDGPQGITLVPASVFDDGSYDNCGPVTFRARRMDSCIDIDWTTEGACIDHIPGGVPPINSRDRGTVHRPCVPFACCDVGAGPIMVELEVTDAAGNINYCMIEAVVQDKISPFIECPPDIIVSCDFWFNVEEGTFVDGEGNNDGSLDEDPLSAIFGNMFDAFAYNDDESVRQDIIINDPGNEDFSQPHFWGIDGWADDNCEVNLSVRVRIIDDCSGDDLPGNAPDGAVRLIERRFSASDGNDGNAPGTCTQRIWVVDYDPFYINDVTCNNADPNDGVIWPCDVVLTTCPEDLGNTGEPTLFDDACSLIGVTYEDTRFDFVDSACFKILREWKVIDWCQYDPQSGYGLWSYIQVIKVHDHEGPEFEEPCDDVVLCVADPGVSLPDNNQAFLGEDDPDASSCSAHLNLCRVVHETCSDFVTFDVKIYPNNGDDFWLVKPSTTIAVDSNNNAELCFDTRNAPQLFIREDGIPYNSKWCGDYHRILWTVEDGCGNFSTCEYLFRLEDCKQPSPVCINGLSTVVMPVGGQVTIWAKDFDASSFDDCTAAENLLFSFSGDAYEPSFTYTCDNVPAFNVEIPVQIWVADEGTDDNCNDQISWGERNKDFCTTTIVIADNNNVCDSVGPILEGLILTEHTDAVAKVAVTLTSPGHFFPLYVTAVDGKYNFTPVPLGNDYTITPVRDDEHRNGVSTLDLVRIQKHLLGKEVFTSPYQYIAADANNSESVSAIDLVEIRKLILGIYTEFPSNESWRFVEEGFQMNPENPWPFNEIITINDLADTSLTGNDFVGVKVGDVNNTAQANATQILPRNGRRVLNVIMESDLTVESGDVVDVKLRFPEKIDGFQWTFKTNGLKYEGVSSETMDINDSHIGLIRDGVITMSWNVNGTEAPEADQVIHLHFTATSSGDLENMIQLTSLITEAEAYTPDGEILDVKLGHNYVVPEFALYQNNPNPWNSHTTIGFDLPTDANVTFTVFDVDGKTIKTIEGEYKAGYNTIILNVENLPGTGVMYYRLESGEYSATKKMVLIK